MYWLIVAYQLIKTCPIFSVKKSGWHDTATFYIIMLLHTCMFTRRIPQMQKTHNMSTHMHSRQLHRVYILLTNYRQPDGAAVWRVAHRRGNDLWRRQLDPSLSCVIPAPPHYPAHQTFFFFFFTNTRVCPHRTLMHRSLHHRRRWLYIV